MEYKKPTQEMLEKLKEIAPGRVSVGEEISKDYYHDEMTFYGEYAPDAVVAAASTEEISAVCRLCYENDVPIIPRGAGTGLSGGCVAIAGGVVIDTQKMNRILGYDLENFIIRVQAGAYINDIAEDCAKHHMLYPPDPGEKFATVGGNVSTNAGGMRACKYGTTRDYVRAMTVVMPNGDIIRMGAEVSKNCSGYSLLNLMCGSEGTLGIITELSMKIIPQPVMAVSLLAPFASLDECISCVSKLKMANLDPQALEFLTRGNVAAIERFLGKTIYPAKCDGVEAEAYLLVTFDAVSEEVMDATLEKAADVFVENGALDVMIYDTADAMRNVWLVRGSCLEAILADFELTEECDVVVPIPQIANLVNYAVSLEDEIGLELRVCGHAGDGNVHIIVCANGMGREEFMEKSEKFVSMVTDKGVELGGMVSGEHGIGSAKVSYLTKSMGEAQMELMKSIKKACDPKMLLNPGKVCYSL
ncbi:MAG: FAD-binding oxidoreductase [Clostridiales bacterium]|nr:FAD-binding oxidoreductase [Clostridiales bacterium]